VLVILAIVCSCFQGVEFFDEKLNALFMAWLLDHGKNPSPDIYCHFCCQLNVHLHLKNLLPIRRFTGSIKIPTAVCVRCCTVCKAMGSTFFRCTCLTWHPHIPCVGFKFRTIIWRIFCVVHAVGFVPIKKSFPHYAKYVDEHCLRKFLRFQNNAIDATVD